MNNMDASEWRAFWVDAHASGHAYFDFLTAVDRLDVIELVAHAVNPDSGAQVLASCRIAAAEPRADSLSAVYSGAAWHERESSEMFGVTFVGLLDSRPLLLRSRLGVPPLRKSTVLAARVASDWPGTAEPGRSPSRRRQRPPGVPDSWLESQ